MLGNLFLDDFESDGWFEKKRRLSAAMLRQLELIDSEWIKGGRVKIRLGW